MTEMPEEICALPPYSAHPEMPKCNFWNVFGYGTPYILKSRHTALEKAAEGMATELKEHLAAKENRTEECHESPALQQYQQYKGEK